MGGPSNIMGGPAPPNETMNAEFVGYMFHHRLVKFSKINDYVEKIFSSANAERLECLCRLLNVGGLALEKKSKRYVNGVFERVKRYRRSLRGAGIQFKLQELVKLWENKWEKNN